MKFAYVAKKYVIADPQMKKFLTIYFEEDYSHYKEVDDLIQAEKFDSAKEAQEIIDNDMGCYMEAFASAKVVPVEVAVMIEMPGPVPTPKELSQEDIDLGLEVAQFVLENEETRQTVGALLDVADEELIRLKKELYVYMMGMVETKLPEEPVETNAE